MYTKFHEVWTVVFEICEQWYDLQICWSQYFAPHCGHSN